MQDEADRSGPEQLPERRFGWWDMFVSDEEDPRADGGWGSDERAVLTGFLRDRRLTLELKCAGLDAEQLTRASVPPSDLTLLGLVRHLAGVECHWFQRVVAGEDVRRPYETDDGRDGAFTVEADPAIVEESWSTWRAQVARTDEILATIADLGQSSHRDATPVREILVHVIREYAQHAGHADFLRERIDGRVGQ